jgi:phosphatidylserine/phosphatidylglycerophosphate/cardiolipin synthase-like enzyme
VRGIAGIAVSIVGVCLLASGAAGAAGATPDVVAVYPDPVTDGDRGEFVVLDVPAGTTLSAYRLSDGESTVSLPNATGRVAVAFGATEPATLDGESPIRVEDGLRLANAGDHVELRRNDTTVSVVRYDEATEGAVLEVGRTNTWRPLGATDRPVVDDGPGRVRAFALPDAGGLPVRLLRDAENRILLAGYTLTSRAVTDALVVAARRNATVRVLVEGGPVGGVARQQIDRLDRLAAAGVDVRAVGGPRARYRYHHPKYAVVDDRAVVTTENWKPSGVGGHANRGWGVVTNQSAIVEGLTDTFHTDAEWRDAVTWSQFGSNRTGSNETAVTGTFPSRIPAEIVAVNRTELVVAPDNAEGAVLDLLRGADDSIWIEQPSLGGVDQPFVRATLDAARRGVSVRVLLGSAWYNEAENRAVADRLRAVAERGNLDLEVRLVDPDGRFDRLHAKGLVVDGRAALVGSLNWNNNSARRNREVALVLRGPEVGGYFESVIRRDWSGVDVRILVGLGVVVLATLSGALAAGRRIDFVDGPGDP